MSNDGENRRGMSGSISQWEVKLVDQNSKPQPEVSREEFEELKRQLEEQQRATATPGLDEIANDVSHAVGCAWENLGVAGGCLLVVMLFVLLLEGCWWPAVIAVMVVIVFKAFDK